MHIYIYIYIFIYMCIEREREEHVCTYMFRDASVWVYSF